MSALGILLFSVHAILETIPTTVISLVCAHDEKAQLASFLRRSVVLRDNVLQLRDVGAEADNSPVDGKALEV